MSAASDLVIKTLRDDLAALRLEVGTLNEIFGTQEEKIDALREELAIAKRVGPPHFCGLPMSLNPHPEAGVPGRFLEVGTVSECIPCLVSSRHGWAKTAGDLQQRLAAAEQRNAAITELLRQAATYGGLTPLWHDKVQRFIKPTESGASE